jgi:hypothetical protein
MKRKKKKKRMTQRQREQYNLPVTLNPSVPDDKPSPPPLEPENALTSITEFWRQVWRQQKGGGSNEKGGFHETVVFRKGLERGEEDPDAPPEVAAACIAWRVRAAETRLGYGGGALALVDDLRLRRGEEEEEEEEGRDAGTCPDAPCLRRK